VFTAAGDISSEEFVDFFVSQTSQRFGRLDYCVNCAGILGRYTRSTETSTAEFDRINSVNYRGSWLASRAQLRAMLLQDPLPSHDADRPGQRGSIVNIASQIGMVGRPNARKNQNPYLLYLHHFNPLLSS
jgi:NAD(P)-dependent dehydrogenase (short-subunit alcohol dehydrogenase family)